MDSVWVFQDLSEDIIRVFAREEDAKKYALIYFDEAFEGVRDVEPKAFERERARFMENWTEDEGFIRLEEIEVE